MLYILIYILLLNRLTVYLCNSFGKPSILSKVPIITAVFREPPEGARCAPPAAACAAELCFPMNQRLAVRWANKNQCFFIMQFSIFHNLTGVPILAMFLTWHHHAISCVIHQRYQEFTNNQKSYICPMKFQCFYVSTSRPRFGKVIKNRTGLAQHEAL